MFTDRTHQPFYFTEDGASDRGYHVYEPQNKGLSLHMGAPGYYWEDVRYTSHIQSFILPSGLH